MIGQIPNPDGGTPLNIYILEKLSLTLRQRQVAFAICCRMPRQLVAQVLGLSLRAVHAVICDLLTSTGCASETEFALFKNAAVSELL